MFHKAKKLELKEGTALEVTFLDGVVKEYDMSVLFAKYPQLEALKNRELFLAGKLIGAYGIVWNDELDIETETIYQDGTTVKREAVSVQEQTGAALAEARNEAGISQKELAKRSGIDQSDISKIERGAANPSVQTLARLADAIGGRVKITFET